MTGKGLFLFLPVHVVCVKYLLRGRIEMSDLNELNGIVVSGMGLIGCARFEAFFRRSEKGVFRGRRLEYCTSDDATAGGKMKTGNNLGISVRPQISEEDMRYIKVYRSVDEVLENASHIDAVMECGPTNVHMPRGKLFDQAGIHTLIEKPLGLTPEDVYDYVHNGNPNTIRVAGHNLPYFGPYLAAAENLKSQIFGHPTEVHLQRYVIGSNPNNNPANREKNKNPFFDLSIHDIHFALFQFGTPNQIQVLRRGMHAEDKTFLSRLSSKFTYDWGAAYISGGAAISESAPGFHHGFSIKTDMGVELAMSLGEHNGAAMLLSPGRDPVPLELPDSFKSRDADTAPFDGQHDQFFDLIDGHSSDAGPLDPHLGYRAVRIASLLEESARSTDCNWAPFKP